MAIRENAASGLMAAAAEKKGGRPVMERPPYAVT
jgi:hypothetical protein